MTVKELVFKGCYAKTETASGKSAFVYKNDRNINRQYFQLIVEDKTVFCRGSLSKVFEKLNEL